MLVLSPESACDVCAESYGADSLPHSIPCGHTFCAPCLTEIAKRHPHRGASCPLCREPFGAGDIRRIRTDQGVSSSPPYPQIQPYPNYYPAPQAQQAPARGFGAAPLDEDALDADGGDGDEDAARRLELRVLDATKKGNSFEDLSRLKREIDQWVARRPDREHMALKISAALLAAILVNGFQHNEARKTAKLAEDAKRKLESENYRLKVDISKLTGAPPPPPPVLAPPAQLPAQPPPPPVPVPVPVARAFGSSLAAKPSPLSKLSGAPTLRSQTPGPMPSHRPSAPAPTHRTLTPGPTPTQRTLTPAPSRTTAPPPAPRSQTPAARTTTTTSSASPYSPFARASATTSHLPVTPSASERHRVWMPSTPREDDDVGKRPGTAAPPAPGHGRSFSFGFARPRTANGHR